jgi:hypothetical protein
LATVTAVALLLGAVVALPPPVFTFVAKLTSQAVFLVVLLGVIHGRGRTRTFCIGGLVAAAYHFLPELLPGRGADAVLAELLAGLVPAAGFPGSPIPDSSPITRSLRFVATPLASVVELLLSVVALGYFSVWVRGRIERRGSK